MGEVRAGMGQRWGGMRFCQGRERKISYKSPSHSTSPSRGARSRSCRSGAVFSLGLSASRSCFCTPPLWTGKAMYKERLNMPLVLGFWLLGHCSIMLRAFSSINHVKSLMGNFGKISVSSVMCRCSVDCCTCRNGQEKEAVPGSGTVLLSSESAMQGACP